MKTNYFRSSAIALAMACTFLGCEKGRWLIAEAEPQGTISTTSGVITEATCTAPGWASQNGGTTGGGNATPTVVSNYAALKAAIENTSVKVIQVNGTITIPSGGRISFQDQTGKTIFDLLHSLSRSEKTTVLVVTHDLSIAGQTDKVFNLKDGKLN